MLCKNPYMRGVMPCPCQNCLPCRVRRAALWTNRLLLEKLFSSTAAFLTLSYRDEELQDCGSEWIANRPVVPVLVPEHVQTWLKRFRKAVAPTKVRYYAVGEYGERTKRPHYHIALFGFPGCANGRTNHLIERCCDVCALVEETWGKGSVDVGQLNEQSAAYIAGYVTKKLKKQEDKSWIAKKQLKHTAEFQRMSLKPGIGADAVKRLVSSGVSSRRKVKILKGFIDAPVILRRNGSILPLGRYLRRKWREALGRSPDTPKQVLGQYLKELQRVYQEDKKVAEKDGYRSSWVDAKWLYAKKNSQKIKNLEAKTKIHSVKGKI